MDGIYIPRDRARIIMPGNQPDWPAEGRAIDPLDAWQRRMVLDGDLILKPDPEPEPEPDPEPEPAKTRKGALK